MIADDREIKVVGISTSCIRAKIAIFTLNKS
jgi:hypothetical protein